MAPRSREFGIRLALGAQQRVFASLIHGVRSFDAPVYLGVSLALGITAIVATWLPSRRATRIDPAVALRSE